jgi:hypothetical protein
MTGSGLPSRNGCPASTKLDCYWSPTVCRAFNDAALRHGNKEQAAPFHRVGVFDFAAYRPSAHRYEGVVLSRESRSSEKFMHGIKVLMAKNYIDNLSEEARKGMQ